MGLVKRLFTPSIHIDPAKVARWGSHSEFTPDYWYLEGRLWQLFLITDDMMQGHRASGLLEDKEAAQFICPASTYYEYLMFKKVLGKATFPVVLDKQRSTKGSGASQPWAPIRGELWAIRPYQILELDKHRLNTVEFNRRRVRLDIQFKEVLRIANEITPGGFLAYDDVTYDARYKDQEAWMYVGDWEYWHYSNMRDRKDDYMRPIRPHTPNLRARLEARLEVLEHLLHERELMEPALVKQLLVTKSQSEDGFDILQAERDLLVKQKARIKKEMENIRKDPALRTKQYYLYTVKDNVL